MRKLSMLLGAAALIGSAMLLNSCGNPVGPTVVASPTPAPSPSPVPTVNVLVTIGAYNNGRLLTTGSEATQYELKGSLTCSSSDTGLATACPQISKWDWSNYSDIQAQCEIFGSVNTSSVTFQCNGAGTFTVQASVFDFSGAEVGQSPVLTVPIG